MRYHDMLTENLPVGRIGSYRMDDWEREFALGEVLAIAFIVRVLELELASSNLYVSRRMTCLAGL